MKFRGSQSLKDKIENQVAMGSTGAKQGLKPKAIWVRLGTTKVMPCYKAAGHFS